MNSNPAILLKWYSERTWMMVIVATIAFCSLLRAQNPPPKNHASSTPTSQYLWIEAEDFSFLGGWQLTDKNKALMGQKTGRKSDLPDLNRKASTKISIEIPGKYKLWVRAMGSEKNTDSRHFSVAINSVESAEKLGTVASSRWEWQCAGLFTLAKGHASIELDDTSRFYARCDKLLLTTNMSYSPKGAGSPQNVDHLDDAQKLHPSHYARIIFNDLNTGTIANQQGGTGFQADRFWTVDGALQILDGDLQLPAKGVQSYIRSQTGKPAHLSAENEKISHAQRPLEKPMHGQVWFSFLVKPAQDNAVAGIKLMQLKDSAPEFAILASGRDLVVTGFHPTDSARSKEIFPTSQTSVVLGRIDIDENRHGERSIDVWVNPDVKNIGEPLITQKLMENPMAISHLALVISAGTAGTASPQLDEVILSNYRKDAGYFHVSPRKRHIGLSHIPAKVAEEKTSLPPDGYQLVFADEFNSDALDRTKWDYRLNDKDDSAQEAGNVEVSRGNLLIHAKKERIGNCHYSGGGVVSKKLFVYGYYEARFKIPSSEGWHTSFWTMPVYLPVEKRNVEIDFCEQDSGDPNYFSFGVINHRETKWEKTNVGRWVVEDAPNMVEEYVVIGSEFTPEFIRFFMNGRLIKEVDADVFPHGPATVQLSCIASLKKGDRFQNEAQLPSRATFDYVRVYQNPKFAEAEAAALDKVVMPKKPLPPISERQRKGVTGGTLD